MKKLLLLLIATVSISMAAQESVVLRYNYEVGDVYEISVKMTQEMGVIMAQTTKTVMSQKTVAIKGDTIVNESKIKKMTMNMLQGGQTMDYDSSKSDDELDEMGKMMKTQMAPMFAAVVTSKTNKLGDVLNVSVEPNIPQVQEMGNQNSSVVYPKEAVKVGTSWSSTDDSSGMVMNIIYTVKSISDNEVTLTIGGNVTGMATGKVTGEMIVDIASGVTKTSSLVTKMDIQGQTMDMNVDVKFEKQ